MTYWLYRCELRDLDPAGARADEPRAHRSDLLAQPVVRLAPQGQTPREDFWQSRQADLPLRFFDRIPHAIELDDASARVDDAGAGAGVVVPRLADGADVDQEPSPRVNRDADLIGVARPCRQLESLADAAKRERHMRVAEEADGARGRL